MLKLFLYLILSVGLTVQASHKRKRSKQADSQLQPAPQPAESELVWETLLPKIQALANQQFGSLAPTLNIAQIEFTKTLSWSGFSGLYAFYFPWPNETGLFVTYFLKTMQLDPDQDVTYKIEGPIFTSDVRGEGKLRPTSPVIKLTLDELRLAQNAGLPSKLRDIVNSLQARFQDQLLIYVSRDYSEHPGKTYASIADSLPVTIRLSAKSSSDPRDPFLSGFYFYQQQAALLAVYQILESELQEFRPRLTELSKQAAHPFDVDRFRKLEVMWTSTPENLNPTLKINLLKTVSTGKELSICQKLY